MRTVIKYDRKGKDAFYNTLRKRVMDYMDSEGMSTKGGSAMIVKAILLIGGYIGIYSLIVSGYFESYWVYLLLYIALGFGMAFIGLAVGHDANHGSFSDSPKLNAFMSNAMDLIGGSSPNWRMQHNVLHHTYTNIQDHDEDINSVKWLLRFSPHVQRTKLHRFQYIYAWFFYGLLTVSWVTLKDFKQLIRYNKMGLLKTQRMSFGYAMTRLILWKLFVYAYLIVIPYLVLDFSIWQILLGVLVMMFTSGLVLSCIFQPAHVIGDCDFPIPDDEGLIHNEFAIHQLTTTSNFAPKNKLLYWLIGGLNYQVEHHLFPQISHVHYQKIAPIVKSTAKEFGLPYHEQPTFLKALIVHGRLLKDFGRAA